MKTLILLATLLSASAPFAMAQAPDPWVGTELCKGSSCVILIPEVLTSLVYFGSVTSTDPNVVGWKITFNFSLPALNQTTRTTVHVGRHSGIWTSFSLWGDLAYLQNVSIEEIPRIGPAGGKRSIE